MNRLLLKRSLMIMKIIIWMILLTTLRNMDPFYEDWFLLFIKKQVLHSQVRHLHWMDLSEESESNDDDLFVFKFTFYFVS